MPTIERQVRIKVGNKTYKATPLSQASASEANVRIQNRVQHIILQAKKTRRAAVIAASKIVLNA